ncbi:GNAT family N-acetyltransferase [Pseudogemmobacter sonorensis]|uniref:GNAT family N-acetyltransferase n=1 Tax=Pseudogemmobacter sonorensis TaxID=2989681 RepID=UPI0036A65B36
MTSSPLTLVALTPDSTPGPVLETVLALNAVVEEKTSPLTPARLRQLLGWSAHGTAAMRDGRVLGFLIGFAAGSDYDSPNYRWFATRLPRFAYIDRVVVAPEARGRGIARALYADFAAVAARHDLGPLVCEVNSRPPNPGSDAFHAALGFAEIGRARSGTESDGTAKEVRYLRRAATAGEGFSPPGD